MVRSEGNTSLKNPVAPPEIDPGTVRLVAQQLNRRPTFSQRHVSLDEETSPETRLLPVRTA
jgi:hypothetical protein